MHKLQAVFWIYALVGTAGLVAIVPSILRAIDGHEPDLITSLVGFFGTAFGAIGTVLNFTSMRNVIAITLAALFGVAAAAVHGEILSSLQRREPAKTNLTHEDV